MLMLGVGYQNNCVGLTPLEIKVWWGSLHKSTQGALISMLEQDEAILQQARRMMHVPIGSIVGNHDQWYKWCKCKLQVLQQGVKMRLLNHEKTILQQASEVDACAIGLIISNHEQCRLIMNDQAWRCKQCENKLQGSQNQQPCSPSLFLFRHFEICMWQLLW